MKQYCLEDFNKKILKFDTMINNKKYTLSSHRNYSRDNFDRHTTYVMAHDDDRKEGQKFILNQVFKGLYQYQYYDTNYGMKNWSLAVWNKKNSEEKFLCFSKDMKNLFKLIKVKDAEKNYKKDCYTIQEVSSNLYIHFSTENKSRDDSSYFSALTPDKEKATEFHVTFAK